jgi:dimethylamine monooxygenase subunit A
MTNSPSRQPFVLPPPSFKLSVGARPLGEEPLIALDPADYVAELALKAHILSEDYGYYCQALPGSLPAQWELLEQLLPRLALAYPQHFQLTRRGAHWRWQNMLLDQATTLTLSDAASLAYAPLDWLGRQVQEDLLLLAGDEAEGFPLIAGQLCFANHWCLDEKLGQPLLSIHAPVPGYAAQVGRPSNLLLARLRPERPLWRRNWAIVVSPALNQASRFKAELEAPKATITATNAGERCYYRSERQTLMRLPRSGAILFTIRTHVAAIGSLCADPAWASGLRELLRGSPPELLRYKGLTPYAEALLAYLEQRSAA